jgi:hypothetical protein
MGSRFEKSETEMSDVIGRTIERTSYDEFDDLVRYNVVRAEMAVYAGERKSRKEYPFCVNKAWRRPCLLFSVSRNCKEEGV